MKIDELIEYTYEELYSAIDMKWAKDSILWEKYKSHLNVGDFLEPFDRTYTSTGGIEYEVMSLRIFRDLILAMDISSHYTLNTSLSRGC